MRITILTDNTPCSEMPQLVSEHGLSIYIEFEETRILCDTGVSTAFWHNAEILGIDLQQLDAAFISHGHKDHSGGLLTFLQNNDTTSVYLSPEIFHHRYFTSRHTEKRDISTDQAVMEQYDHRLLLTAGSTWITNNIAIVKCATHQWSRPVGNAFLTAQYCGETEKADDFSHELSLVFRTAKGLVVVSSCSHNGALNIMESCKDFTQEKKIFAFIGGLHFVDCNRTALEVDDFQKEWNRRYPDTLLYTGHCTSDKAKSKLKSVIPHLHIFHTGETFIL